MWTTVGLSFDHVKYDNSYNWCNYSICSTGKEQDVYKYTTLGVWQPKYNHQCLPKSSIASKIILSVGVKIDLSGVCVQAQMDDNK